MKHPLTDEMIDKIAHFDSDLTREQFVNRNEDMRAAADWQLEQVIIQWEEVNSLDRTDTQVIREFDKRLKAMLPAKQDNS